MATLKNIFDKCGVALYQNESLDLDHYYQEPYQDEGDEIKVIGEPFETDKSKKIRPYDLFAEDRTFSNFSFFMDGSRRTYKIGDIVIDGGKKIYPVVIAQIRAGCTERDGAKKLHSHQTILRKNLLLLSDKINTVDFKEIQQRLMRTAVAKEMFLEVVSYRFESEKHNIPVNAAIAKANSMMHDMEIEILSNMVKSGSLDTDRMLIVDGPLQFLRQDTGKAEFSDLFYNVIGVSKSFNPMLPASGKSKRGGTQIGAELLKLEYGERTPVFMKENDRGRRFGVWYLRIRPKNRVSNPLEGIIKIEKMALEDYYDSGKEEKTVRKAMERGTFDDERKETVEKALSQTEAATKKVTALNTKIVNAGYATKNDLPSSYSRDERKLYQRIISIIDSYFASEPQTAEALREKIKLELSVKKK